MQLYTEARTQLLENLLEITKTVTAALDLETVLKTTIQISIGLTGATGGNILLLDPNGAVTQTILSDGKTGFEATKALSTLVMEQGLAGWVARHAQIAVLDDVQKDDRWIVVPDDIPARSALCVPLLRKEVLFGVLTLQHRETHHFTPEHAELMQLAADQIALALDNARLYAVAQNELARRQQIEEKLQQSELLYRNITELITDFVYYANVTPEKTITLEWVNSAFETVFGYTLAELRGANGWAILIHPHDMASLQQQVEKNFAGAIETITVRCLTKTRQTIWVEVYYNPVWDGQKNISGVLGGGRDVTKQKQAQEALRASEAKLQALVDNTLQAFVLLDEKGLVKAFNRKAYDNSYEISGSYVHEGQAFEQFIPEANRASFYNNLKIAVSGKNVNFDKFDPIRQRWFSFYYNPVRAADGSISGASLVKVDITERKQVEEALRQSQAQFKAIFDSSLQGLVLIDQHGIVQTFNPIVNERMRRIFGKELKVGVPATDFVTDASKEGFNCHLKQALAGMPVVSEKFNAQFNIWESFHYTPVYSEDNQVIGVSIGMLDITERKQLEQIMTATRDQALEASRLKSEFLANMSHEIRTPINAIVGMIELLQDTILDETQHDLADTIGNSAQILLALINDILDFSKIEAARLTLEIIDFNPLKLIEETVALLNPQALEKKIGFDSYINLDRQLWLQGDSLRLRQVLLNLLSNALKFTRVGAVSLFGILEDATATEAIIRFEVRDSGIGIPANHLDYLFQPFSQADTSTTRQFGGTGLGLSISQRLVNLMGSDIKVYSTVGEGSTFWFTLTLPFSKTIPLAPSSDLGLPYPPNTAAHPQKILLAEDNSINQKLTMMQLNKLGYQVDLVNNGEEAIAASSRCIYDLILMDCMMPTLDGFEATRAIRQFEKSKANPNHVPIIAITANAFSGDKEKCLEAGMDDYLSKPVNLDQLQTTLKRWIPQSPPPVLPPLLPAHQAVEIMLEPALDSRIINSLRQLPGDTAPDMLTDLINIFLEDSPNWLQNLTLAITQNDSHALLQIAHLMKGSSANLGAVSFSKLCLDLEKLGRTATTEGAIKLLIQLENEYATLKPFLQSLRST